MKLTKTERARILAFVHAVSNPDMQSLPIEIQMAFQGPLAVYKNLLLQVTKRLEWDKS